MEWTWQKVVGLAITGLLVITLIFANNTGLIDRIKSTWTNATSNIDKTSTEVKTTP